MNVRYTSAPGEHRKGKRRVNYRRVKSLLLGDTVVIRSLFLHIIPGDTS